MLYVIQLLAAFAAGSLMIFIGVENPNIIGANAVMGAIAATWLIGKGVDARNYGLRGVLPGWRPFLKVSGAVILAVVLVVVGFAALGLLVYFIETFFGVRLP